jgi:hypothetical protein
LILSALLVRSGEPSEDDAWQLPVLEGRLDSRLRELESFPAPLYPPDLEEEVAAGLEDLARLDPESAAARARSLLASAAGASDLAWTARRILVACRDLETVRSGLRSYFEAPGRWRDALSAAADPRLRDFGGGGEPAPASERLFLTTLERNLSRSRERESIRALLAWASTSSDPSSPRRVLQALAEDVPLHASVAAWLRRRPQTVEAPESPLFAGGDSPLEIQQRVLAMPPEPRYRSIRRLAEQDHEALLGLPLSRAHIDRLYPYFARSSRRAIRDRVRRAGGPRGRALASVLRSPVPDAAEKLATVRAMPDAWAGAIAAGGLPVFEILSELLPREELERFLEEAEADESLLEALAVVPLAGARLRLESLATPEAVERIVRRPDRVLSVAALSRLRRDGEPSAARAAALALLSLGAPGASAWLRAELANLRDPAALLLAASTGSVDSAIEVELARRIGSEPVPAPGSLAILSRLPLIELASAPPGPLAERVHRAMSVSGDPKYLPVLVDVAAGSLSGASPASREAAFAALAEADLGSFAPRLHRLAGDPDRGVRFRAAAALVPSGEAWTIRLLLGNLDRSSARERAIARAAVFRLSRERARELLSEMIEDGTATSFGALLFLDLGDEAAVRRDRALQRALWTILEEDARAGDSTALLAASRLSHAEAVAVVTGRLSAP